MFYSLRFPSYECIYKKYEPEKTNIAHKMSLVLDTCGYPFLESIASPPPPEKGKGSNE